MAAFPAPPVAFFGGPDRLPGALRDLLHARIEAVGAGGAVDWMTYYLRDQGLVDALIAAHRRGAAVRLCLEGSPRSRGANDPAIRRLADPATGIGAGLRVVRGFPSHLHTKLYGFSHPRPHALVGSFNPSGNGHEPAAATAAIGDQDRGHNLLVEVADPVVLAALVRRVALVHAGAGFLRLASSPGNRFGTPALGGVLLPRPGSDPLRPRLDALGPRATLRVAASHVRDPGIAARLGALARRGAAVTLLTHHTARRTPARVERRLRGDGVRVLRYRHHAELPMHAKFLLAEDEGARWCAFGSYNLTLTSRWLNQELLMFSDDAALCAALDSRWRDILAEPWTTGAP